MTDQPPIVIVALKQPSSRLPPSSTKAAMVRSAIRPRCDVPQLTQRSQNSRAVVLQPEQAADGEVGQPDAAGARSVRVDCVQVTVAGRQCRCDPLAAGLGIEGRVGEPEQADGFLARLMPDGGTAERIGHVAVDQRRRRRPAGPVGRLRGGRYQRFQEAVMPQADHVDEVAGLQAGEPDLNPPRGPGADDHDPAALGRALVHQQGGRPVPFDDRPGNPPDFRPDAFHRRRTRPVASHNCMVALPERRGRHRTAAPGLCGGGQRETLFASIGFQDEDVRADIQHFSNDGVHQCRAEGIGNTIAVLSEYGGLKPGTPRETGRTG
jgi:hypothetical protein